MELTTIHFSELQNFNDSNSIVCTGLILTESDIQPFTDFFHTSELVPESKNVIGIHRILDNILGDEGRTDWLVTFDREDLMFNVMRRLALGSWVKWTSDFIDNFANDYNIAA